MTLRDKVTALLADGGIEFDGGLADDTSLIRSGRLDSLTLFNLALLVEGETGRALDLTTFDLRAEWDTIAGIERFVARARSGP